MKTIKTMVTSMYLTLSDKNDMAEEQIDFGLPIQTQTQLSLFESKLKNEGAAAQYVSLFLLWIL